MSTAGRPVTIIANPRAGTSAMGVLSALIETTKPGITRLVAFTSLVGFVLVSMATDATIVQLIITGLACSVGTALASAGACSLNMWMEAPLDAKMGRTQKRAIPTGRLLPKTALLWGCGLVLAGVVILLAMTGPAPALLALLSAALYIFAYTPLKTRTQWCTVVGTVPGALPTLIGAAAGAGLAGQSWTGLSTWTEPAGLALFALLAVWQLPHFYALAWMYRKDYAAAGMRMIAVVDPTGRSTRHATVATAALLVPAAVSPALASDLIGWPYAVIAAVTSLAFFWLTIRLLREKSDAAARRVFFGSIIHLPLLMIALVVEAAITAVWFQAP